MKKILLFSLLLLCFIGKASASTSSAHSYTLMDMDSGRVLLSKDMHSKRLIASITKIMTSILAIESGKVDDIVKVDDSIKKAYGSGIYIEVGEEISLKDLLYGLMMRSGNDAALMIASFVSGSEEEFVTLMNRKAKELGMNDTTFYNASGLPTPHGNISSTYDMALLTKYAMNNDIYREIVSTKKYQVTTNKKTYIWHNKNKLLRYDFITGGKTGYTEESGRTLVSTSNIDDMHLVVVTIRDSDDWNTHLELYNYAKNNYDSYRVLNKNKFYLPGDSSYSSDTLYIKSDRYLLLKKNEKSSVTSHILINKKNDYKDHDKVGKVEVLQGNNVVLSEDIYVIKGKKKEKENIFNKIKKWFND